MFSFSPVAQKSIKKSISTINRDLDNVELSKEEGDSPLASIFNEAQTLIVVDK